MAVMGDPRKAVALQIQVLLKDAKASQKTVQQKLTEAADLMLAQQTVEQEMPVADRITDAAILAYKAYGTMDGLAADARKLRADIVRAHAEMSYDLSSLFSDAATVTNNTVNGGGGGRRNS